MPLDAGTIRRACKGASVETARFLCRDQIEQFRKAAGTGEPLTVACTQEAPLFSDVAGEHAALSFVNVREAAGWSDQAAKAGPKMAALLAAAAEPLPAVPVVTLESEGVALIYG